MILSSFFGVEVFFQDICQETLSAVNKQGQKKTKVDLCTISVSERLQCLCFDDLNSWVNLTPGTGRRIGYFIFQQWLLFCMDAPGIHCLSLTLLQSEVETQLCVCVCVGCVELHVRTDTPQLCPSGCVWRIMWHAHLSNMPVCLELKWLLAARQPPPPSVFLTSESACL